MFLLLRRRKQTTQQFRCPRCVVQRWCFFSRINIQLYNPIQRTEKCLTGFAMKLLEKGGHGPFFYQSTSKMKQSIGFLIEEHSTSKAEACLRRTERVSVSLSTSWITAATPIWSIQISQRQGCYWRISTPSKLISTFRTMMRDPTVEQCLISHHFMRNARQVRRRQGAPPDKDRRIAKAPRKGIDF